MCVDREAQYCQGVSSSRPDWWRCCNRSHSPACCFTGQGKLILQFQGRGGTSRTASRTLKNDKAGSLRLLPHFRTCCGAAVISSRGQGRAETHIDGTERAHNRPAETQSTGPRERNKANNAAGVFSTDGAETTGIHTGKNLKNQRRNLGN